MNDATCQPHIHPPPPSLHPLPSSRLTRPTHPHSHPTLLPSHTHSHAPPTHVHVHPQYTGGGPVLVQWVPTSYFGLQVEQEVVRKPEDKQWITATHTQTIMVLNTFIALYNTYKLIQCCSTQSVLCRVHGMACSTHTQHTHTPHTSQHHTHLRRLVSLGRDVDGWSCQAPRCLWGLPLPCPSPLQLLLSVGCG